MGTFGLWFATYFVLRKDQMPSKFLKYGVGWMVTFCLFSFRFVECWLLCWQKPNPALAGQVVLFVRLDLYTDAQRFRAWRRWRFFALNFLQRTEPQIYEKLSFEVPHRHFCKTRVMPWRSCRPCTATFINIEFCN
jgi:hypothetical protein